MIPILTTALGFFKNLSWKVWSGVAAALLLAGTVAYCNHQVEERVEVAQTTGEERERTRQLETTVKNVETAREAVKDITEASPRGDAARYNQCLRTARTPENCERFLPSVQETER